MPAPATPATAPAAPSTSSYTIAPGRTIDGKLPGDPVDLTDSDAIRFIELGFILDGDGSRRVSSSEGPAVNVEDGVQIKPA